MLWLGFFVVCLPVLIGGLFWYHSIRPLMRGTYGYD